jgi:hypothetical protein
MATLIQCWENRRHRARHEKMVAHRLEERAITPFLSLMPEVHHWSDRKRIVEVPWFGCYLFARIAADSGERLRVLRVEGVLRLVGGEKNHQFLMA